MRLIRHARRVMRPLALVAMQCIAADLSRAAAQTDVTVVAPLPKDWQATLIVGDAGAPECRVIASTGDAAIDARGCAMMWRCFDETQPQFLAAADRHLRRTARQRLLAAAQENLQRCFRQRRRSTSYRAMPDRDVRDSDGGK